jgi:hypothetical protein
MCDEGVTPLRGTVIWPVLANRVFLAVSVLLSSNKRQPTWFLAPSFPSALWLHIHASTATAFTTILFDLVIQARSSRLGMFTRLRLLTPVILRTMSLKAIWILPQMTDALYLLASLGLATAASAWANLP